MKVEIWSDIMCPFCYIGKRNFEKALSEFEHANEVEVIWKSYQLDPSISEDKVEETSTEYLANRKGMRVEQVEQMYGHVLEMAKKAGLTYHLKDSKVANSYKSHRIMKFASEKGLGSEAEEAFFKAHFTDGKDLNDAQTRIEIGKEIGLTEEDVNTALNDAKYEQLVKVDIAEASQFGISGVPFFVIDRKYAVSGAQSSESFLEALETAFKNS